MPSDSSPSSIRALRVVVASPDAPAAIGPYSQAVKVGGFVYLSGQIPLDPKSGELVDGAIEEQVVRVMENIRAVLKAADATFADIVKTTIFLTNLADFQAVNGVYSTYFDVSPPARSTIQVAALPRGAAVEIEVIAYVGE
jgi:2-iminobutanoate/2-iminopropanoate deaminase